MVETAPAPGPDQMEQGESLVGLYMPQGPSPYVFDVPLHEWPLAEHVLVLLLYVQAEGIGGLARLPRLTDLTGQTPDVLDTVPHARKATNEAVQAVRDALEADTFDDLRGGLIIGDPEELRRSYDRKKGSRPTQIRFALASCQYPSDFLDHMPNGEHATRGPADASLLALADLLGESGAPTLLLLAGDQVYIDATAGLFDPKVTDDRFRMAYERRGQSRGVMAVTQRLNLVVETMLDDHEIRDNWANDPDPKMRGKDTDFKAGKQAFLKYQRGKTGRLPAHLWRNFTHDGVPFFLSDTRTEREGRTALNCHKAKIMGQKQFDELCAWLTKPEYAELPKFVLTPSAILPRRREVAEHPSCALHSDAWDGYPRSFHALLKFVCDKEVERVVFLSGDEHLCNVVTARVTNCITQKQCTLHSVHSSGLYSPYPFANGVPDNFQADETFLFPNLTSGPYRCEVRTSFVPGDGFALIAVDHSQSGWHLNVGFHGASGLKENGSFKRELG
ncbi:MULTISPECIES: alkaline phosphatase D family protein [unclassified Mesorhizobium]|uniref:alkaline phosphatase D family protein n=1 Tax=unclassified Mesorhizobium TaxID=325217 RepID=UPI001129BD91|nr:MULTISPECIES: alkaline phosphatase D family protein [unclassified Mesorhizobium]TPL04625.1 hypothetical protein FJ567_03160 [Mesorhizobium sp. B2-4-16]TPL76746.1 hypothetical protein FJ956_02695 [Mesorhizobium sp. B2-4-3]